MFEFSTREQREAWRVIHALFVEKYGESNHTYFFDQWCDMEKAAARFDAREATCGIQPLSLDHALLIYADAKELSWQRYESRQNVKLIDSGLLTDKGREVLAKLNAMCKVTA